MGNQKLLDLYKRLDKAQLEINSLDVKIKWLLGEVNKASTGYTAYSRNICDVVPSFLKIHKDKYGEAEKRYLDALAEEKSLIKYYERISAEVKQYVISNCVPQQYRKTAIVSHKPFDNFVTMSYYLDEESRKEGITLRLYLSDENTSM